VYISGERAMFEEIWQILTNTKATVDDALDMAGEVANVITGNVRENLGKDFMISVPMTFVGKPDRLKFHGNNLPVYVIPLTWKNHEAFVVIALSES
jgi:chemotaxis protein CheX